MALFGGQLIGTLIMVSIIQKFGPYFSFAKWLLCSTGLLRYLPPTDDELKLLAGKAQERNKGKWGNKEKSANFHIPRNANIVLQSSKITMLDIMQLRFFVELKWLLDFSMYAAFIYIVSEMFHIYYPLNGELNLSVVWCAFVVLFTIKLLVSITTLYFKNGDSMGERSVCIVACLVYLLISMIALIVNEDILETGLEKAYTSFNESALIFLRQQNISSSGPASKIVLKFFLAVFCGLLGSLLTFPGLRLAKMHYDSLKYCRENKILQVMLKISFILPFLWTTLWIKPIGRDYLTVKVLPGLTQPLLTANAFESVRLLLAVFLVVLRFGLLPIYLQSYLNIAHDRVEQLKKETGQITNVELQRKISSVFRYLCVVSLQITTPLILCLYLTFMYKSLGGISWTGFLTPQVTEDEYHDSIVPQSFSNVNLPETLQHLQINLKNFHNVFPSDVYRGFLGFVVWWSYLTLFISSAFGILYQTYFTST